jgi:NAD(P)-dependent dehydrogenase (short-subunit alcohol dehydrogenase family)
LTTLSGIGSGTHTAELTRREVGVIRDMINSNLVGTILMCRAVAGGMMTRRAGKIINISSIAGLVGRDRQIYADAGMTGQPIDYAAAKAGVIGATLDLAAWLGPYGIRVNAISPGGFGPRALNKQFVNAYSGKVPLGRMGRDTIDIKGAALFLATSASDYVNGHNLVVDGGFSVWK